MRIQPDTTAEELKPHLFAALRAWHNTNDKQLLDFLLLVRTRTALLGGGLDTRRRAVNEILLETLDVLAAAEPEDARLLRLHYLECNTTRYIGNMLNLSPDHVNRRQAQAVLKLAGLILEREQRLRRQHEQAFEIELPPRQYTRLFGAAASLADLGARLAAPNGPRILVLSGMGGLGKTALAHQLTLEAVHDYTVGRIHWLGITQLIGFPNSPEQLLNDLLNRLADRLLPAEGSPAGRRDQVRRLLKRDPHLVIIDNLESEGETGYLLEQLQALSDPGKFLLTTRANPVAVSGSYIRQIEELGRADAAALVQAHAAEIGLGTDYTQHGDELRI